MRLVRVLRTDVGGGEYAYVNPDHIEFVETFGETVVVQLNSGTRIKTPITIGSLFALLGLAG